MSYQIYVLGMVFILNSALISGLIFYKPVYYKELLSKKKIENLPEFINQSKQAAKKLRYLGITTIGLAAVLDRLEFHNLVLNYIALGLGILGFTWSFYFKKK